MGKRKLGFTEGKSFLTVSMKAELVDLLAARAVTDRRSQSVCVDIFVESYLSNRILTPMPQGSRIHRSMVGGGETKIRRYRVEPRTVRLLQEARALGYSQSFILEEAIKEGVTNAG